MNVRLVKYLQSNFQALRIARWVYYYREETQIFGSVGKETKYPMNVYFGPVI